jgi:hypothetical protein
MADDGGYIPLKTLFYVALQGFKHSKLSHPSITFCMYAHSTAQFVFKISCNSIIFAEDLILGRNSATLSMVYFSTLICFLDSSMHKN